MTGNRTVLDNGEGWLHEGHPQRGPAKDYFALLALLQRSLSEDEVVKAAKQVLKGTDSDTVTEAEIRAAIEKVTTQEPNSEEIYQVASRLASVGWPLGSPTR